MTAARIDASGVVAAIDFADDWQNTVAHAVALARTRGGSVHLLHVIPPPNWLLGKVLDPADLDAHCADLERAAREKLEAVAASFTDVAVRATVKIGRPAMEIVESVRDEGAGVLVLGMAEPTGTAMTLGPTADRLFRVSPVPVWVTGPKPPEPIESLVVPTALGPGGLSALQVALDLCRPGGTVSALYMVALPSVLRGFAGDLMAVRQKMADRAEEELKRHLSALVVPEGVRLEPVLRTNLESVPGDRTIVREAREREADLVCFALGGSELPPGMLIGRVSEKVVRSLPCALLALPDAWTRST